MYSLLDGYGTPKEYLDRAKEIGLKAFCITEHGNAYSWCYFDKLKKDYWIDSSEALKKGLITKIK
jgi:DNA polymerase-3 subunit alpha